MPSFYLATYALTDSGNIREQVRKAKGMTSSLAYFCSKWSLRFIFYGLFLVFLFFGARPSGGWLPMGDPVMSGIKPEPHTFQTCFLLFTLSFQCLNFKYCFKKICLGTSVLILVHN